MVIKLYQTPSGRSPVGEFILSLTEEDQVKLGVIREDIEKYGLKSQIVVFRKIQGKLWEIKLSLPSAGVRIAYIAVDSDTMYWLHAFKKKSQKMPQRDRELALKRLKEVTL